MYAEQRYKTIMPEELKTSLPEASLGNLVAQDYLATGLSLKAHPVTILDPYFLVDGWHPCSIAIDIMDGKKHQL